MPPRTLIVCASPAESAAEHAAALAGDADLVIAVDGGLGVCRAAHVTPSVVVGDLDSVDAADMAWAVEARVPVESFPSDKDVTDLDLAIEHARLLGASEVTVTACMGGRVDHELVVFGSLALHAELRATISEPTLSAWVLDVQRRPLVDLEGEGSTVSILALGGPATVSVDGVRWPLRYKTLGVLSSHGVSNVIVGNSARITVHDGVVVVLAPVVDGVGQARFADGERRASV